MIQLLLKHFIKNSQNEILFFRIVRNNKTFTLIPQIPLHPGRTYTVIMDGAKTSKGINVKPIIISYTNRDLDFGLYWYGKNGLCEKYFPGVKNAFYSDEKKSLIFTHGIETKKSNRLIPMEEKDSITNHFIMQKIISKHQNNTMEWNEDLCKPLMD